MWVAYTTLSIAHIFNNDLKKKFYEKPDRIDDTIMPYSVCYAAIIMYEWSYIAAATIMIAYTDSVFIHYTFLGIYGTSGASQSFMNAMDPDGLLNKFLFSAKDF